MKKIDIALLIGLIVAIFLSNFNAFAKDYDDLRTDVVRLHILANSDSEEDQALKLKVRDAVLANSSVLFEDDLTYYETEKRIFNHLDEIQRIAESVIKGNGYTYAVQCALVNMEFDERVYEDFTMPAGNYDALRITIGAAEGHNWWCVMYPPLCLPAAEKPEKYTEVFTAEEIKILQNPQNFKIEFKCVELYKKLKQWLKENKDEPLFGG